MCRKCRMWEKARCPAVFSLILALSTFTVESARPSPVDIPAAAGQAKLLKTTDKPYNSKFNVRPSSKLSTAGSRSRSSTGSVSGSTSCSRSADKLLTNGFFQPDDIPDMHNVLLMATMSNDIYPWAKQYGNTMLQVVQGLNSQQLRRYQRQFTIKYTRLGATSVQFMNYYQPKSLGAAGHAAVIGTSKDVFVVFRGTSDFGQGLITGKYETQPLTVFNKTLDIYYPVQRSLEGLFPQVLKAVRQAIAATDRPRSARIYLTGHSLGAASACVGGLLLKDQGFRVAGVWAFDPYKAGTTCAPNEDCWVSLYDRHLGDVTWMIWNNQDPIPILVDAAFGTSIQRGSPWGHVPRDKNWIRIVGDKCLLAAGTRLGEACPPEVDAADGKLDGNCPSTFYDHLPWVVLQKVAHCALLQPPAPANARQTALTGTNRLDTCATASVWSDLLGLEPPRSVLGLDTAAAAAAVGSQNLVGGSRTPRGAQ